MRLKVPALCAAVLIASLPGAARANDAMRSLAERLQAAAVVVEGEAGRPYTAWNGTDPTTIVTYTPFTVHRVLKGRLTTTAVLVREPGGEVGGAGAVGDASTEFVEGERDVVLLGERDLRDGSYPITMNRGAYQVTRDTNGRDSLDIHLGVDAGTYPSREKGSGTPPMHVPLELVERLARGERSAEFSPLPANDRAIAPPAAPAAPAKGLPATTHRERAVVYVAALALILASILLLWRRRSHH